MIILRYLLKEILVTTSIIALVLFLLSFGNRFAQYLEEAWQGRIAADVLFTILAYRIPQFLMINLPISFFIAILLSYGRLYADNEMVVLSSCGVSKSRLLAYTLLPAVVVSAIVASLTLLVGPGGLARADAIQVQQRTRSELSFLTPNRLQTLTNQSAEIYFQRFGNEERTILENIFIAEMSQGNGTDNRLAVITAASGQEEILSGSGRRVLQLRDVYQYVGQPGASDYLVQHSDTYDFLLDANTERSRGPSSESLPTATLLKSSYLGHKSELHWRLALPIVVLVVTLIAVPLSYTSPRQGRFYKLFPALVLIILYMGLLSVGKSKIEDGEIPVSVGLWWVHALFLLIAVALLWWNNGQHSGKWRRSQIKSFAFEPQTVHPVDIEVAHEET